MRTLPLSVHKARGTYRKDRHGGGHAPDPKKAPKVPKAPEHLDEIGQATWTELAPVLWGMGCLTPADVKLLETYCATYSRWRTSEEHVQTTGAVVKSPNGFPVINPHVSIARNAVKELRQLGEQLGLSPSSRTKIKAEPTDKPQGIQTRNRTAS